MSTVMEVVEQGVSGSKSRPRTSDEPIFKEEKTLAPASRRVREAAEALLSCIMEQVRMSNMVLGHPVHSDSGPADPAFLGLCCSSSLCWKYHKLVYQVRS